MNTESPWDHLITIETIGSIHRECIELFGGDRNLKAKDGCVEGSVGSAWSAEQYSAGEGSTAGLCFAACLLFYLVKNHCFTDGNKRVAWAACMEVLRSLGLTVEAETDEAEKFCLDIINDKDKYKSAVDATHWLAPRLIAIPVESQEG